MICPSLQSWKVIYINLLSRILNSLSDRFLEYACKNHRISISWIASCHVCHFGRLGLSQLVPGEPMVVQWQNGECWKGFATALSDTLWASFILNLKHLLTKVVHTMKLLFRSEPSFKCHIPQETLFSTRFFKYELKTLLSSMFLIH